MTVCVAAYSQSKKAFVCAVDEMISATDISADSLAIKFSGIGSNWVCMFSAADLSPVRPIIASVRQAMNPAHVQETVTEVIAAFKAAFEAEKRKKIEATVLPPGITLEEFYRVGLRQFGPDIFARTYNLIETVEVEVSFLVCGFSEGRPCLFTFSDPGIEKNYDLVGFWAIGSGTNSAIGSLFNLKGVALQHRAIEEIVYRVCEAKFYAESALGVGKATSAFMLESSGERYMLEAVPPIRTIWENNSSRPLPAGAVEAVRQSLKRPSTQGS
jgi:hypothetical protein